MFKIEIVFSSNVVTVVSYKYKSYCVRFRKQPPKLVRTRVFYYPARIDLVVRDPSYPSDAALKDATAMYQSNGDVTVSTPTCFVTGPNPNMPVCLNANFKGSSVQKTTYILYIGGLKVEISGEVVYENDVLN